ncbi:MAG: hypothetical protein COV75_02575 [Candidatus Omnitrophica bacterium CG11_big_fil_rev_8_21_14_0_20_63_9]|nr:MAG: hypothetical protein COV75_02575 [Candidatus Omnitrophica bacterium CG11_big_fil_rev_8_21_14_0_20_63_9]
MGRTAWGLLAFGFGLLMLRPSHAEAVILINEVLADPPAVGGDANGDGVISPTQDEFVELFNTGTAQMSLAGWTLWDATGLRRTLAADAAISGQGFFVVFGGLGLNNDGDTVSLFNETGILQDRLAYGPEGGMDASLTRFPDGEGSFTRHTFVSTQPFSPGASAAAAPPSHPMPEPCSLVLLGLGGAASLFRRTASTF